MNIKEFYIENKKTFILFALLISILTVIVLILQKEKIKKRQEVTIKSTIKQEVKLEDVNTDIKPFIKSANIVRLENKSNIKLPFIEYHDKFMINLKYYNKLKNFQLDIDGDIKVKDKQLKNYQLAPFKMNQKILSNLIDIQNLIKIKKCKRVTARDIFIYINKGISITYRIKQEFIQFNILDNKIFVWQERDTEDKLNRYLLCNFNSTKLFDKISDYVQNLQDLEEKR